MFNFSGYDGTILDNFINQGNVYLIERLLGCLLYNHSMRD